MNRINEQTIVEAVCFLLSRFAELNKLKIVKLLYLADKYHLLHYGRTITRDEYYAMRRGPVGSATKNILSFDVKNISAATVAYAKTLISSVDNVFQIKNKNASFKMLSESDREALAYVIKTFGHQTYYDLYNYTHQYPEWKKHEQFFKEKPNGRKKIAEHELFNIIDNKLGISKEQAREALTVFSGC
jgi:uncharacterized phage-associated protein